MTRRSVAITELVCRMTETDILQISVVEDEELKELVRNLKPEYVTPSRATVTKSIERHLEEHKDPPKVKLARHTRHL